ncbi:hypothetical protein JCM14469_03460 [Desulfatiferula olefinivorans]
MDMRPLTLRHPIPAGTFFTAGRLILVLLLAVLGLSRPLWAADPALRWDANADADYYVVYWRTAGESVPGGQSDPIDAGTLSYPLWACDGQTTWYYSVKAFNACGNSSDFSDEIQTTLCPAGHGMTPPLPGADPVLEILLPAPGDRLVENTPIDFSATAYRGEQMISAEGTVWRSSLDGPLGTGADITAGLSTGTHIIRAALSGSTCETAVATLDITVAPNTSPTLIITGQAPGSRTRDGQTFMLTASAEDSEDGDLTDTVVWRSSRDGDLGRGAAVTPLLSPGSHTLTASVTDRHGAGVSASVTLTARADNTAPVVTLSPPATGAQTAEGQLVTFSARALDAEDGDLSDHTFWLSDLVGELGTGATITPRLPAGTHRIEARVKDTENAEGEAGITVTVARWNREPSIAVTRAEAGIPAPDGRPFTFTGLADDAEDGDLSNLITWTSSLSGPLGRGHTVTALLPPGRHRVEATVCDSGGKCRSIFRDITVDTYDAPPVITLSAFVDGEPDETGRNGQLQARADDPEDGDLTDRLTWTSDIQGALGSGSPLSVHLIPGRHSILARVLDQAGHACEARLTLMIDALDRPPVLRPITVTPGAMDDAGQSCILCSRAEDPEEGDISADILWTSSLDGNLGSGAVIETRLSYGRHTLSAAVTDTKGNPGKTARLLTLTWINQPPAVTITSLSPDAAGTEGQAFTVACRAVDEEAGDLSAQVVWTSSRDGRLGTGTPLLTVLSPGTHIITAKVSDQHGIEAKTSRSLTVESFNQPPTVTITALVEGNMTSQGRYVDLSGSALDPEDGRLDASLAWTSDRDGFLGKGPSITPLLSAGRHLITARVTDSSGKSAAVTMEASVTADTELTVQVSSRSFYYFTIVTISWSGGLGDVALFKNERRIGAGGPDGSRYYWSSGTGRYSVCEMDGGRCADAQVAD